MAFLIKTNAFLRLWGDEYLYLLNLYNSVTKLAESYQNADRPSKVNFDDGITS